MHTMQGGILLSRCSLCHGPVQASQARARVCCRSAGNFTNGPAPSRYTGPRYTGTPVPNTPYQPQPTPQVDPIPAQPGVYQGPRLQQWLQNPFDFLALGPRATLGVLSSLADLPTTLPHELQKLNMLAQDPRPLQEKQSLLAQELDTLLADLVEKGVAAEADVFQQLRQVLPGEVMDLVPSEFRRAAPMTPAQVEMQTEQVQFEEPALSAEQMSANQAGALQRMPSPFCPPSGGSYVHSDPVCQEAALKSELQAQEVLELKEAVSGLKDRLTALRTNTDIAKDAVLKVNIRDARDGLNRRLRQLSPTTVALQEAPVAQAESEATQLLMEVDAVAL